MPRLIRVVAGCTCHFVGFVLQYFLINFELSISVDATFYGVTVGMDQTTQAGWLVGRISCRGSGKHPQLLDFGCVCQAEMTNSFRLISISTRGKMHFKSYIKMLCVTGDI